MLKMFTFSIIPNIFTPMTKKNYGIQKCSNGIRKTKKTPIKDILALTFCERLKESSASV